MAKVLLGDVVNHIKDKVDKDTTDLEFYVGGEHIDGDEITVRRKGLIQGSTIGPAFHMRFQKGDVLLMSRNPHLRKASMVDFDGICSDVSYVCRTKDNNVLLQSLLPFILQTTEFWQFAEENKKGGLPFFLNWKDFARFEFELIPIERQQRIADLLWAMERTKNAYRELIARTDDLVKSQFIEMFGDPYHNPKGWPNCKVQDIMVGKVSNGFFAKPTDYSPDGNAGIICVGDVVNRKYSNIENLRRANAVEADYLKYAVHYGDALFCRSSLVKEGIGKASIIPKDAPNDMLFECHVIRVQLNTNKVLPEFFQAFTSTKYFRQQMIDKSKTATMTTIGQKDIVSADLFVPERELQVRFAELSEQSDKSKNVAEKATAEIRFML